MDDFHSDIDFEALVGAAIDSLPDDLRSFMSNVAVVVEEVSELVQEAECCSSAEPRHPNVDGISLAKPVRPCLARRRSRPDRNGLEVRAQAGQGSAVRALRPCSSPQLTIRWAKNMQAMQGGG